MRHLKRRDGFEGEKLVSLPELVWKKAAAANPVIGQLYITHIGYFPRAAFHYRERRKGCSDNILIYCLRGRGWYSINDKRFEVQVNEFIILPATTAHLRYGADETDPWTIYWVHFSGGDIDTFNRSFGIGLYDGARPLLLNENGIQLWHQMYEALQRGFSKDNLGRANLCLYHFLATFLFPEQPAGVNEQGVNDRINDTISFMQQNLGSMVTVEELAKQHGLSASHFSSLFKKATGMAPLDYFIHLKLQKACLLLYSTDMKVKNVATAIGYDDPYHFSRLFKKTMKVSPDQYRLQRRKG